MPIQNGHTFCFLCETKCPTAYLRELSACALPPASEPEFQFPAPLAEKRSGPRSAGRCPLVQRNMLFDVQDNIQISGRPAERARFAESGETNARAVLYSRRDFGFDHALAQQAALASALRAGIGDNAARALAGGAGSSDAEKALLIAHLASSVARLARHRSFARRRAAAAAGIAGLMAADVHFFVDAKDSFLKFEFRSSRRSARAGRGCGGGRPARTCRSRKCRQRYREILEDGRIESCRTASAAAQSGVPEAVI